MKSLFFEPYIGDSYNEGLYDGRKVLVLGDSHYCPYDGNVHNRIKFDKCDKFEICTSREDKDSSSQRLICPYMGDIKEEFSNEWMCKGLSLSTKTVIKRFLDGKESNPSHERFSKFICEYFHYTKDEFWERVAFYNYIQFFLPESKTKVEYISSRDDVAFKEMLNALPSFPDVIISWGTGVGHHLRNLYKGEYKDIEVMNKFKNLDDKYLFDIDLVEKKCVVLNCRHPSRNSWKDEVDGVSRLSSYMNFLFPLQ